MHITASHLYSFISCPHRIKRDAFDDPNLKDTPNEFVQMLWEKGIKHERDIITQQKAATEILDLSGLAHEDRFKKTLAAMRSKAPLIYQGYLKVDDLVGMPDLLELQPNQEYLAIDIKSGMGRAADEGDEDGKLKKEYAVQIGLYTDVLIRLGYLKRRVGKILDSRGVIVDYDLDQMRGPKTPQTWWVFYNDILDRARSILNKTEETDPALGSVCKLCEWYSDCKTQCVSGNVTSLIPELGRKLQADFKPIARTVKELASVDVASLIMPKGKTTIPGIGQTTLEKMNRRAKLLVSGQKDPMILQPFVFPERPIELFLDIETDPTQDIVYLHGVVERRAGSSELKFNYFLAESVSESQERQAWKNFWNYMHSLPKNGWVAYYYSKYERTQYRLLAKRYPEIVSEEEVEWFFETTRSVDLYYDIVKKCTDWPTYNYSIKTLAQHLGFKWRDESPSGAASIQWFNDWQESKDTFILKRILEYNEDDCLAMIVVKDKLASMQR